MSDISKQYTFSIIIPTFNGRNKITYLLDSILSSDYDFEYEIIIIVDGSTDDTLEVLAPYQNDYLKVIFQENGGRSIARNNGVKNANGAFLLFLDDDIIISENCLKFHQIHHFEKPDSVLVGKLLMDLNKCKNDFNYFHYSLFLKWEIGYDDKTTLQVENLKFTTGHLSISKNTLYKIHGFDSTLTDAEDYDLAMRLLDAKVEIYYDPSIVAWHDDFPSCSNYIKRQVEYRLSHQKLIELGKKYQNGVFLPMQKPKGIKKIVVKLFSFTFWINWVEKEFLLFLPKKFRFKMYATIIYAHTLKGLHLI